MKPHTPIPLVLCEGKEDLLVMETLAKQAGLAPGFLIETLKCGACPHSDSAWNPDPPHRIRLFFRLCRRICRMVPRRTLNGLLILLT
jgi:hypothetical protein